MEVHNPHLWHEIHPHDIQNHSKKLADTNIYIYLNNIHSNINTAQLVESSKARSIEPHGTLQLMKSEPDVRLKVDDLWLAAMALKVHPVSERLSFQIRAKSCGRTG